jgi:cytidine deaminase
MLIMDNDFEILINEAKKIATKRILSDYASCGDVGCALLTKKGKIYTGICIDSKCALGNCAEYAAIAEMLKNNESEIEKIVAYSAKGTIYAPCGRCRELIRMVNKNNVHTKVMVAEGKVSELQELLPEMYITKKI